MNYPQEIKGTLVTLHILQPQHFEKYHAMMSATVRQALGLPSEAPFENTCDFLANEITECAQLGHLFYVIFDAASNKLIGAIKIRAAGSKEALDRGMVGSWLNENYWGGGRYLQALGLAVTAFFAATHCPEITAYVATTNQRSLRAHQKYGFEIIGRHKQACCDNKEVYVLALRKK